MKIQRKRAVFSTLGFHLVYGSLRRLLELPIVVLLTASGNSGILRTSLRAGVQL